MVSNRAMSFVPVTAMLVVMGLSAGWAQVPQVTTGANGPRSTYAVQEHIKKCVELYNQQDLSGAEKECDEAVNIDPNSAPALYNRGLVRFALEDFPGALADYNEADKHDPQEARILFGRGVVRYKLKDKDGARADYDRAIKLGLEDPTVYLNRGVLRTEEHDWDGAEKDFARAIKKRPDFANAYVNRADERMKSGDKDGALEDYNKALTIDHGDASTFYNRGVARFERNDMDGAIQDYDASIKLNDHDPKVYYDRGVAHERKGGEGEWKLAIEDYRTVVSHWHDDGNAYFNLGVTEYKLKDYQASVRDYGEALRVDGNWANAFHGRGLSYEKLGGFDNAISDYTAAVGHASSYSGTEGLAAVYFDRGVAYQKKFDQEQKDSGLLANATADYGKAIELGLKTPEVYYNLGFAYQREGKTDDAITNYGLALQQKADDGPALRQLGEEYNVKAEASLAKGNLAGARGEWDAALKDLEQAKTLLPEDAAVYDALGRAHYGKGEYELACADYTKEIEIRQKGAYGPELERRGTAEAYVGLGAAHFKAYSSPSATAEYKAKEIALSIEAYKKATEVKNDYALAYCDLNAVYLKTGQYEKATDSRNAAQKSSPDDAQAYCKGDIVTESDVAARQEFEHGQFQEASQGYRKAIAEHAGDAGAHYGLGVSLYESEPHDLDAAIAEFDTAISEKGDYAEAYNGRGLAYRAKGNLEKAETDFRKGIELQPDFSAAQLNLAEVLSAQKKWAEALVYYKKSAPYYQQLTTAEADSTEDGQTTGRRRERREREAASAWEGSGLAKYKTGDLDGATADFTMAIRIKGNSIKPFMGRGDVYVSQAEMATDSDARKAKWTQARADYDTALENLKSSPESNDKKTKALLADILLDRGMVSFELGDRERARKDYSQAISLKPENERGYYDLGDLSLRENHLAVALRESHKAVNLSGQKDADAFDVEGIAQGDDKHLRKSLADFDKAVALKPDDTDLLFNRALVEVALNQIPKAITDLDAVIAKNPSDPEAYYRRGIAKGASGNFQDALADYGTAIRLNPNFGKAYANRWDLYRAMGDEANAKADLEMARKLRDPDAKRVTSRY